MCKRKFIIAFTSIIISTIISTLIVMLYATTYNFSLMSSMFLGAILSFTINWVLIDIFE